MAQRRYFVYILTNWNNKVLYTGITNNLERRLFEHKNRIVEGFTTKYNVSKLVYYEEYNNAYDAITREKQIKNWHRQWKINLIKSLNSKWDDLSNNFF
ncbi:MAG: hypothetical protein A3J62_02940 [Candidatus Buchananbacteria bacterium RIFCSPHIGHO2_02_FULL_38_8]|uniref:GIY-YIG domain-containing protein n=2 Tax=Candidatus Buchananiibacteriota TaxID=1817903 RepID=A0A1G1XXF4_9BACT|nr:MAG: hypothetical protein A2731_03300 [Candidatus Buchananbacteria bacterium RIFCSPHIGHO2_01_FULL_39_8]OGY47937.1 MAG: hypothetical protein A3J62_02940 [Candidatus Buchananbacteria bacterium RIFCSPHIGHO2_02_FULL_38_8]